MSKSQVLNVTSFFFFAIVTALQVCGRVDVSVGIVVPMALEEHKTALGVAGWMEDAVAEHCIRQFPK